MTCTFTYLSRVGQIIGHMARGIGRVGSREGPRNQTFDASKEVEPSACTYTCSSSSSSTCAAGTSSSDDEVT